MNETKISKLKGICLAEIGGSSCAGCHQLMPVARQAALECGINFYYLDADEEAELISEWGVTTVPSLYLTEDGVPFASAHGYQPKEILTIWIEHKIEEHKNGRKIDQ